MIGKTLKHYTSIVSKLLNGFALRKNGNQDRSFSFVDSEEKISSVVKELKNSREIAVDIEGNSLYGYGAKICLVQISTRNQNFIIDPMRIKISFLKDIFSNPKIEKILHGSAYDIQMLYHCAQIQICNLFDTQIAAQFLGEKKTGLAGLVEKYFNVVLQKKYQKSNWAIRPLSDEMLEYAVSDTRYLLPLADRLKEKLNSIDRIEWVKEECEYLALNGIKTQKKTKSIRGMGKISGEKFAIAQAIIEMREDIAREKDLPPFRIIDRESILKIASSDVITEEKLRYLTAGYPIIQKHLGEMIERIKSVQSNGYEKIYHKEKKKKHDGSFPLKTEKLYRWREKKAEELKLAPHLILSHKQIVALAETKIKTPDDIFKFDHLKKWQKKSFGKELGVLINPIKKHHKKKKGKVWKNQGWE